MKKETNVYKIQLDATKIYEDRIKLVKLKDSDEIASYNTRRFADILGNKIVFVSFNTNRIDSRYNPHIAQDLIEKNCDNWRIDELDYCIEKTFSVRFERSAEYDVNFETGDVTRKMKRSEGQCKHCNTIVDKKELVGSFCNHCLTARDGLAYRFAYHAYNGGYPIYEKNVNEEKTPVFGAEIERDYLGNYDRSFDDDLTRATIGAVKVLYGNKLKNANLKRNNVFMSDGSLDCGGIEWITFPQTYCKYRANKEKLNETLETMKKYCFGNSSKVGNHIHINRRFFGDTLENNDESRFAGAKMALLLNEYWKEFIAIAKRQETSYASKPSQSTKDKLFTLVKKTLQNESNHSVAVNLQHNNTIEIRIWGGIDNADDLLLFLDLTQALAILVKKKSLEYCQNAKFIDILKLLTDKVEHLKEIKKRLNEKGITKHNQDIENLIKSEEEKQCA